MQHNRMPFDTIAKGHYGRKIAYANADEVTVENIMSIVSKGYSIFNYNRPAIDYLWRYYKGDQPALYRVKVVRDDIINHVVENHAYELVNFKTAQSYGEPIQAVALVDDEKVNEYVDKFNDYMRAANKPARDISCGTWQSAVGVGFKAVQITNDDEMPFRIVVPTPLNTFMVYSAYTDEPLLAVQELKDQDNKLYKLCYSATHQYRIQNGQLTDVRLHAFGGIPIVEYPNNAERLSDIELVITMLDAINNMQSNRMDAVEQFVQSWVKFVNCEVDATSFKQMKAMGALAVHSEGEKNVDVDIMSQELKQSETQVAKDDLWDNVLSISAIPNKQGNGSGDTQGAVELRNGWDFSKQRAKMKDPVIVESERKLNKVILNILRIKKGGAECPLGQFDYDVQINHSPTDNMQVKAEALQMLLSAGIHPLIAIKVVGLFEDADKTYILSKPYLDNLYKTIDDIEDAAEQEQKAQELLTNANLNNAQTEE